MAKKYLSKTIFLMLLVFVACSTKKNRLINRAYHAMTTEYNILYNGDLALQKGLKDIEKKYSENYWEVLPIERLEIKEEAVAEVQIPVQRGVNPNINNDNEPKVLTPFELAEEKAVKAVQKHSMKIGNVERNSRIDEAYMLLGKARYYAQRFVPALEAFTYVKRNYPEADLIDATTVWRAKTNIRLESEETAIETLNQLLQKEKLEEEVVEDAHTTLAMAYQQLDSTVLMIAHLKEAIAVSVQPERKARNLFILGQLYRNTQQIELSDATFNELIEFKKSPYRYRLHAEVEIAKNAEDAQNSNVVIARLETLIENRDNRPYLDALYYQLGVLKLNSGKKEAAISAFKNAIHTRFTKNFQKGLSYEKLGDIYFDEKSYANAGAYYDSVIQVSGEINNKRIRSLKRKRGSLEDVLEFQQIIKENDSIWNVFSMSKENQVAYYQTYIDTLKIREQKAKEAAELKKKLEKYQNAGFGNSGSLASAGSSSGKWYFYNPQTIGFGEQEFRRVWGKRELTDNWRWSDKSTVDNLINDSGSTEDESVDEVVLDKYKPEYYINLLPSSMEEVDSISQLRATTYYKLALIYKEQFKELDYAAEKFQQLLDLFPDEKLTLGANYHLYKIYNELDNPKAALYKKNVITQFPESVFASMLQNETVAVSVANSSTLSPVERYEEIYLFYQTEAYVETIYEINQAVRIFEGTDMVPKLELLKAYALAKLEGKESFVKALNFIVLTYANTEEAKRAKELLASLK